VSLVVVHPGLFTTVQDLGRPGFREWGVPPAGAFDTEAHCEANALLANPPESATLEMTLLGGVYEAGHPLGLALAGAPMAAQIETARSGVRVLHIPQTFSLESGDRLVMGGAPRQARTYLAVCGGWQTPLVLGSRSCETPLQAGQRLLAMAGATRVRRPANCLSDDADTGLTRVRIVDGPDAGLVGKHDPWQASRFRVGPRANRMGLRLEGPRLSVLCDSDRLSTPVIPGTIQWTGEGLLVLGAACGTMGGYPHVAQVISADIRRLAQLRSNDEVAFERVSIDQARGIDRDCRRERAIRLQLLAAASADPMAAT
jgi:allophanate hydrolase subunit 2